MELWNERMRRWVKPGTKGIALIRKDGRGRPSLEYVFDVADTRPVEGAKTPYLWEIEEPHHAAVLEALERQYGPVEDGDIGDQIMELARRAVERSYRDHLNELAYDVRNGRLGDQEDVNLEVAYQDVLTASVQYTVLTRCGLDPAEFMEDDALTGITAFTTPAVLHHLGSAVSETCMDLLSEIGRAVKDYDRGQREGQKNISEKPLAKSPDIGYTEDAKEFSAVKRESAERSDNDERADLQQGGRLPGAQPGSGRDRGGISVGQVRDAAGDFPEGESQGNVHVDAAERAAEPPSEGDRPAGPGAGGQDGSRPDESERRGRDDEGQRSNGLGTGGEQLQDPGGGNRAGGDRVPVRQETEEAAGKQPAASASDGVVPIPFHLFPPVEEQIEAIAQAAAEERRGIYRQAIALDGQVSDAVIGCALTSGSNTQHSIERIVAFFQKNPPNSTAADFLRNEFGEGGKGVTIGGNEYSLWFDNVGFRIAPGRTAYGPSSVQIPWASAATMVHSRLREGIFATQDKIDGAQDNEYRELAEKLWYLRQGFSDEAVHQELLPTISQHYFGKGFPDDTKEIAALLKDPASREQIFDEMRTFVNVHSANPNLLRDNRRHNPLELYLSIISLYTEPEQFQALEDFAPARATFMTEDEINREFTGNGGISEGKLELYSYFVQGHSAKECTDFFRSRRSDSPGKGLKFTRRDESCGSDGYDTVWLSWSQAQKRIRDLIDSGRYLNDQEQEYLPVYEKLTLARKIYAFQYYDPNNPDRTYPHEWDVNAAKRDILPILNDSERSAALYEDMVKAFSAVDPNDRAFAQMKPALDDMGAFIRGEYSLFTPLTEAVLEAERQQRQTEKEARKAERAQRTPTAPKEPEGTLAALARSLAQKGQAQIPEDEGEQISFDLFSAPSSEPVVPQDTAEMKPQSQRGITDMDLDHFLFEDLGDPDRKLRLYTLFTAGWSDAIIAQRLEQEYSRSRHGNLEGGFWTLADGTRGYAYFAKELRLEPRPEGIMRHVSFEEMAARIRQLIQEDRYLTPEELERYQKDHAAQEPEAPETAPEKEYSLGYGFLGNGLTVWNRKELEHGDYKTIAHIAPDRTVKFYVDDLPEEIKREIEHTAATSDARISETQDAPVFSTPPQVPEQEQEQESSHSPWWDEYTALKADHPDCLMIYQIGDFFELFGEDAKNAAAVLDLTLTTRPIGGVGRVEMCGFPVHALEQNVEKLRGQYNVALSIVDGKTGERKTRALSPLDGDSVPYNFEFEYRLLSRLKSDCDYFLGAGGRHPRHLAQGSTTDQIAKMRELYDLLPEKPKWLTAEDIDRYEAQMEVGAVTDTIRKGEVTVAAEDASFITLLLAERRIEVEQFANDNGDVTLRFAADQQDAVEGLIAKLHRELSNAVAASYGAAKPQKAGRSRPELNYRTFVKMFPEFASGEYRYLELESGPSMMPLHLEWIGADELAISHTYIQNGDVMRDPEMTFRIDREKGTLMPLTFQQDGSIQLYQEVYPKPGMWRPKLSKDLSRFAQQWFKNISEQRYHKREAVVVRDGEDVRLPFDQDGRPVNPDPPQADDAGTVSTPEWEESPIKLYRDALYFIDDEINRIGWVNGRLQGAFPNYEKAKKDLEYDLDAFLGYATTTEINMAAETLPKFREWLIEDLLERNYGDNALIDHHPDALERYGNTPDAPEWARGAPPTPRKEMVTLYAKGPIKRSATPKQERDHTPAPPAADPVPERKESGNSPRNPLAPAFKMGDTVYLDGLPYIISRIREANIELQERDRMPPVYRTESRSEFTRLLYQDQRNIAITDFLPAHLPDVDHDLREALVGDGGLLELKDKAVIAKYFAGGKSNWQIAKKLALTYEGISETMEMVTGDRVDYFATKAGFEINVQDKFGTKLSVTWNQVVPILRTLYQQELNGFLHEQPDEELAEPEQYGGDVPAPLESAPVADPTGGSVSEKVESSDEIPIEPDFAPNAERYWDLKAQHPDKLVGVQVGEFMMFYGKDAEEAAPALGTKTQVLDIPGLGATTVTGGRRGWQTVLKKLLEHGHSVLLARPDPDRGPDAPYEIIKERDAADYIPIGMELTIDGRCMKIDSVDFQAGTVSLQDLDMKGWFPIFRSESIQFVREFVEEVQQS